jgi:hypothetical protein
MDNSGDKNTVTDTNFDDAKLVDESPVTISIDEESPATEPAPAAPTEPVAVPAPETPAEPTAETPAPEPTPEPTPTPTPEPTPSEPETITPAPISPNSISSNANTQGQKDSKQLYSIILFAAAGFLIVFALIGLIASIAKLALIICFVLAVACGVVAYKFNNDAKNAKKTSAEMSFKPTAADDKNIAPDFAAIAAKPEPTNTYVAVSPFTVIKYPNGRDTAEEEPAEEASDVTLPDEKKDEEPKTQSLTGPEAYNALTPDMISGIEFGLNAISAATPDNLKKLISSIDFKLTESGNLESSIKSVALSESDKQSVLDFLKEQLKGTTTNPDYSFDKAYGVDLDLKLYSDNNWSINYK